MQLHFETVDSGTSPPMRTVCFIHGILGQGANLRTLAKRLVQQQQPQLRVLLVDLRAHGASLGCEGDDTVQQCAQDIAELAGHTEPVVTALVGHSFGGKVALAASQAIATLNQVVLIDSNPGSRLSARGSEGTIRIVELLERQSGPFATRNAFVEAVVKEGQPASVGQWLAMQLRVDADGFRFALDMKRIRRLLHSYFDEDLWPLIEAARKPSMHLIVASRSEVFEPADIARAERASAVAAVTVDTIDAGHWVHVDAFEALLAVLQRRLA
jgi:esterase